MNEVYHGAIFIGLSMMILSNVLLNFYKLSVFWDIHRDSKHFATSHPENPN